MMEELEEIPTAAREDDSTLLEIPCSSGEGDDGAGACFRPSPPPGFAHGKESRPGKWSSPSILLAPTTERFKPGGERGEPMREDSKRDLQWRSVIQFPIDLPPTQG
ncbi:hypothetical protein KM043_010236 [Ampulex compressa]|nr:hypothetical protein KM043_010236 [Ampulex compressa]